MIEYYIIGMNVVALAIMGYDKQCAKLRKSRVSERTLFSLAMIGGSIGILLGMRVFRHKTKKPSFQFGIPAILLLQIAGIVLVKWLIT
ncbi:DUF1294 domain-containing protein [Bacillus alkalicellulosilyticus]|uniref:DUF1294 domain-containing protein n=1 Tax=Alkalihalobacterium alkalicellulosilyticum TaxID=1912214 RepID=UPI001BAFF103|nr:DUF1294 domain-containing protein [Bacillus alkalicellulosilyticus]